MKDISLKDRTGISNERIVNKIQDFIWDDEFSKYVTYPDILDLVECFTGPDIRAMHTMLINKPPDSGQQTSRHPMHQVRACWANAFLKSLFSKINFSRLLKSHKNIFFRG